MSLSSIAGLSGCDTGGLAPGSAAEVALDGGGRPVAVASLPLRRGYYVASDTACAAASNATVTLLRRDGIGGARDFCEFRKVEQIGPDIYRIIQACRDLHGGEQPQVGTVLYTLSGDSAFSSRSEGGWEHSARYCIQSSMPPAFRANDIGDATG